MSQLSLGELYSREDVKDIFEPLANFRIGSGSWGLAGAVRIKPSKSYVFFVSYGSEQSDHIFKEGITADGVLTWQSQPGQDLADSRIIQWINHDSSKEDIHFFLRPEKAGPYTYLGRLDYLSHDPIKEKPVWFQFLLLDWKPGLVSNELRGLQGLTETAVIDQDESLSVKHKDRNEEIFRLRTDKFMNLRAIGKRFGLSQERVRVIVNDMEESGYGTKIASLVDPLKTVTLDYENDVVTEDNEQTAITEDPTDEQDILEINNLGSDVKFSMSSMNNLKALIDFDPDLIGVSEGYRKEYKYEVSPFGHIIPLVCFGPGNELKLAAASIGEAPYELYTSVVKLKLFQHLLQIESSLPDCNDLIDSYLVVDQDIKQAVVGKTKKFCERYGIKVVPVRNTK